MYIYTGSVESSNKTLKTRTGDNMSKDVRKKIIEAATEVFSTYGYEKTTIEDIARMADKAKTSVYYYFEGKTEIFAAALGNEISAMSEALGGYLRADPKDIVRNFREYLKKRMDLVLESKLYRKFLPEMLKRDNKSELCGIFIKAREEFDRDERQFFSSICFYAQASGALDSKVKPEIFAEMLGMVLKGVEMQILLSDDRSASLATYEEMVNFITNTDNYNL